MIACAFPFPSGSQRAKRQTTSATGARNPNEIPHLTLGLFAAVPPRLSLNCENFGPVSPRDDVRNEERCMSLSKRGTPAGLFAPPSAAPPAYRTYFTSLSPKGSPSVQVSSNYRLYSQLTRWRQICPTLSRGRATEATRPRVQRASQYVRSPSPPVGRRFRYRSPPPRTDQPHAKPPLPIKPSQHTRYIHT